MGDVVISAQNVQKSFGDVHALRGVSFSIHRGEIFGFLGPSGAGKTTTVKILTNQIVDYGGNVTIFNKPILPMGVELYERIGLLSDASGLYERLTVIDNLVPFAMIHGLSRKDCLEFLEKLDLKGAYKRKVEKLSRGMKQRLMLARAMIHAPEVLFLDEPTSDVDPTTAQKIHKILFKLRDAGTAIFLTTHNMHEATKLCNTVALLFDGKIVELGLPEDLCMKYNTSKKYILRDCSGAKHLFEDSSDARKEIANRFMSEDVETIHSCEPSLEDVFVSVTGRGIEDE